MIILDNIYKIVLNKEIAKDTYKMILEGKVSNIKNPGQFINIKIGDDYKFFLRRPISICDKTDNTITII